MSEQSEMPGGDVEEVVTEEVMVEETVLEEAAPSAAAKQAEETHESVVESRQEGMSRMLETMQTEAITLESLSPGGELNFEKIQELAAIIPVEVLYQIEDIRPGSLLELFAEKSSSDAYLFNFSDSQGRLNAEAEAAIGLNYFFKNKPEVRRLRVTGPDGKEEIGDRGEALKGNFYDGDEYVEVMGSYYVQILETAKEESPKMRRMQRKQEKAMKTYETVQAEPQRFEAFTQMLEGEKYSDIQTAHVEGETQEDRLTRAIIERSADAGVDPYLVMSLLKAENGKNGKFFGVKMGEAVDNFEAQLDWAIKIIQHRERSFEQSGAGQLEKGGHYSEEFLIYFSETYSPPPNNPNHFGNLYENYALYSDFKPMDKEKLDKKRKKVREKTPRKKPKGSPDDRRFSIEDVIPDEAYCARVKSYLVQFQGGERVVEAAKLLADPDHDYYKKGPWNTASTCWNWANKVYSVAGFRLYTRGQRKEIFKYSHPEKVLGQYATRGQLEQLQPGDWVYLHVYPVTGGGGDMGDHSLIFLGWEDKENLVAIFADEPKLKDTPHARISTRRLAASGETPVGKSGGKNYYPLIKRGSPGKKCGY